MFAVVSIGKMTDFEFTGVVGGVSCLTCVSNWFASPEELNGLHVILCVGLEWSWDN